MKNLIENQPNRGFSLIEVLMAIAIISMLSAVAMVAFSNINDAAELAKTRQNAQTICQVYGSAKSVGAVFTSTTKEGILDELIEGRKGKGPFAGSLFQLSLGDREKKEALALCMFDQRTAQMVLPPG